MIRFIDVNEKTFDKVYDKMKAAFPYEERRDYFDEKECFKNERFKLLEIYDNEIDVGFTALWIFDSFIFIEHIAIDENKRGKGYGSKAIGFIKETYKKPLILEAEAPETEQQIKRIRFYEQLGFKVNSYNYIQPSYHNAEGVPLMILSFPEFINEDKFKEFLTETRREVYTMRNS